MSTLFLFLAGCCVGAFVRMLAEVHDKMSHWRQGYMAGLEDEQEEYLRDDDAMNFRRSTLGKYLLRFSGETLATREPWPQLWRKARPPIPLRANAEANDWRSNSGNAK